MNQYIRKYICMYVHTYVKSSCNYTQQTVIRKTVTIKSVACLGLLLSCDTDARKVLIGKTSEIGLLATFIIHR